MKRRALAGLLAAQLALAGWALADDAKQAQIESVIDVAIEELGYSATKGGYSKYGDWAGGKYAEWCAEFVSWCADQAGQRGGETLLDALYPMQTTCRRGVRWFTERGRYITTRGEIEGWGEQWYWEDGAPVTERPYIPRRGDLVYIEWYTYNRIDHVGLVEYVTQDADGAYTIHTIEGNNDMLGPTPTVVARYTYALDDAGIRGYGITRDDVFGTTMRQECKGDTVARLQEQLVALGYHNGQVTGTYNRATVKAVKSFQQERGLPCSGVADAATQRALKAAFEAQNP